MMDINFGELKRALEIAERVYALRKIAEDKKLSKLDEVSAWNEANDTRSALKAAAEAVAQENMQKILTYIIEPELFCTDLRDDPVKLEDYITAVLR